MGKEKNTVEMTNSQAKRAARKKEAERLKKQAKRDKIIGYLVMSLAVLVVVAIVAAFVVKALNRVVPSDDYSVCLEENGYIKNTGAADIELPDYNNLVVPLSEVEYTEAELNDYIEGVLENNKELKENADLKVASGDEINLDYVGKVDGEEFEGGSAQGYSLTIGSGAFIPGFEDQLVDASVGSTFDIDVTFPEDYSEDLAGKEAVFTVTINGIYQKPELTDEFVVEHFNDVAATVDEYKQHIIDTNYDSNLTSWIENYFDENSTVTRFDKKYIKNLKSVIKYEAKNEYEYMDEMYKSILGYSYYNSFEDFVGMSEAEYDASLETAAKEAYKDSLIYQAIVEIEGASIDGSYAKSVFVQEGNEEADFDSQVETYGMPYMNQMAIKNKAIEIIKSKIDVE